MFLIVDTSMFWPHQTTCRPNAIQCRHGAAGRYATEQWNKPWQIMCWGHPLGPVRDTRWRAYARVEQKPSGRGWKRCWTVTHCTEMFLVFTVLSFGDSNYSQKKPLVIKHGWKIIHLQRMFPLCIEMSIYRGFWIAMFDYRSVPLHVQSEKDVGVWG